MPLSLEFEEWVGARWHRWASRARSYPRYPDAAVTLDSMQTGLGVFFRLCGGDAGLPVEGIAQRGSGHRLTLRQRLGFDSELLSLSRISPESVQLPACLDVFPTPALNSDLYLWLTAFLAFSSPPEDVDDPLRADILALRAADRITHEVIAAFPGLAARYEQLRRAALEVRPSRQHLPAAEASIELAVRGLLGRPVEHAADPIVDCVFDSGRALDGIHAPRGYRPFLPVPLWGIVERTLFAPRDDGGEREESEGGQQEEAAGGGARRAVRKRQDQAERDDPLVFNRFEKLLSFAEMVNLNRMVDDEPDKNASKTAEQLDELTLSQHSQRAASRLNVELDLAPDRAVAARLEGSHTYPEWDYRKACYLPDQSRVLTEVYRENGEPWQPDRATRRRIERVRQQFEALRPRRVTLRGQVDGPELDTDAAVRGYCDQLATGLPNDAIYQSVRPMERDLAVSVLVDNSLSTEAWLEDRRVIDVSREALWVLAHGLARCGDDYAIATFTSHRRQRVLYSRIKAFDELPGVRVDRRIAALEPGSYTRMGPAIRHAADELSRRPNRYRILLLLSDGKPNDTDYYEGRYAIEDTRRAVLDARQQELIVFAITIDSEANQYIQRLFGRGGYALVSRPEHLVAALPRIYRELTNGAV